MFENNTSNEFLDTNDAVAEKVNDFDDFYDDDATEDDFSKIPVNNFDFDFDDDIEDFTKESDDKISQINFDNVVDGTPSENNDDKTDIVNEETVFSDVDDNQEETEDVSFKDVEDNLFEEEKSEENTFNSLSSDEMDKMIEEDEKEENSLDDSYVLSNFDVLFDSLYNDVNGANNFISDLIEQKKNVNLNEASVRDDAEKLLKEKEEFEKYMKVQKEAIKKKKDNVKNLLKLKKKECKMKKINLIKTWLLLKQKEN